MDTTGRDGGASGATVPTGGGSQDCAPGVRKLWGPDNISAANAAQVFGKAVGTGLSRMNVHEENGNQAAVGGELQALMTIVPDGLNSMTEDGWEEIIMTVDSGASETVINEDMVESAELREGAASRRGISYEVANG